MSQHHASQSAISMSAFARTESARSWWMSLSCDFIEEINTWSNHDNALVSTTLSRGQTTSPLSHAPSRSLNHKAQIAARSRRPCLQTGGNASPRERQPLEITIPRITFGHLSISSALSSPSTPAHTNRQHRPASRLAENRTVYPEVPSRSCRGPQSTLKMKGGGLQDGSPHHSRWRNASRSSPPTWPLHPSDLPPTSLPFILRIRPPTRRPY
ncbi:hypothetical protein EDB81DRAFT_491554 [Dactylonectria macrodidyma]|uniref:Uncharacterized protein n=1 Tax=Dactylonectria macrodidyma TaxID=307937 RepID=A0A9P9EW47_9HYPO|nr:hypothetical protein EDB81DRAFT_491554 [Dactylonectria macrodidyma]